MGCHSLHTALISKLEAGALLFLSMYYKMNCSQKKKKKFQVLSREKYYYHQVKIMEVSFLHNLGFLPFTSNLQKRPSLINTREQAVFKYAYLKAMHTSRSIQGWVFSFQKHKKVPQII